MNADRVKHIEALGRSCRCNCWAATMYVLGVWDYYKWADREEIDPFLQTLPIVEEADLQPGDIVVWRSHWLEHTAIYLGDGMIWHKPGGLKACIARIEEITYDNGFDYGEVSEYRRLA